MAKKNGNGEAPKIPVSEIKVGGVYKTYVNDLIRIEDINETTQMIRLYNVTGAFKQWTAFKNIYLIEHMY